MEYIYGKLNKQLEQSVYKGINTDTASITIDNKEKTIKVDVLGGTGGSTDGFLSFNTQQQLTTGQLANLYANIKLNEYIKNTDAVLLNGRVNQTIKSNILIDGSFNVSSNYLSVNANKNSGGIYVKNWSDNKDALIYVNDKGELRFNCDVSNQSSDEILLTSSNIIANKFTYYTGYGLSTRDIRPNDISADKTYTPTGDYQLTNKYYVDQVVRRQGNFTITTSEKFSEIQP